MIDRDSCILLGTLSKSYGTKGSLMLRFSDMAGKKVKEKGPVFLEIEGMLVPFFLESFQEKPNGTAILDFEGIVAESEAREFAGCKVYVQKEHVLFRKSSREPLILLNGYRVNDVHLGFVGLAGNMAGTFHNPLLEVQQEGRNFLVPFHEDIIREINHRRKEIAIEAPEGLFEL